MPCPLLDKCMVYNMRNEIQLLCLFYSTMYRVFYTRKLFVLVSRFFRIGCSLRNRRIGLRIKLLDGNPSHFTSLVVGPFKCLSSGEYLTTEFIREDNSTLPTVLRIFFGSAWRVPELRQKPKLKRAADWLCNKSKGERPVVAARM